jgi:hypothetical protein
MPKMVKNIIKLVKNNNWKKVKNSKHKNSWQPMRQANMHARGPHPFSFEESVCFFVVPMFPMGSQHVS